MARRDGMMMVVAEAGHERWLLSGASGGYDDQYTDEKDRVGDLT